MTAVKIPTAARRLLAWAAFLAGAAIWVLPSDLVELIVEQKPILLNRYSEDRFYAFLGVTLLLWISAGLLRSSMRFGRDMAFRVIAVGGTVGVAILVLLVGSTLLVSPRYVEKLAADLQADPEVPLQGIVRHRPPNQRFELVEKDRPPQHRSYPDPPPGFEAFPLTLTIDPYGFRNREPILDRYDIVVAGDSYVAGSHVSDEQAWPYVLAELTGKSIYNIGVSGSDPQVYLNNFVVHGLKFDPGIAIFMLYEGNDFKVSPPPVVPGKLEAIADFFESAIKGSPVRRGVRQLSARYLETLFAGRPVPRYTEKMSWMPVAVPSVSGIRYYAFRPKRLIYLYHTEEAFEISAPWRGVHEVLENIKKLMAKEGIRLIYVFAPGKPHVVLPAVKDRTPPDQLHQFASYTHKSLPPPEQFKERMFRCLDSVEAVFQKYCQDEGVEFLSLTEALQEQTRLGVQVYYTYDQHWTPLGNELVAHEIAGYLKAHPTAPLEGRSRSDKTQD
jgi:hypothetical protein